MLILPVFEFSLNCLIYKELCHVTVTSQSVGVSRHTPALPDPMLAYPVLSLAMEIRGERDGPVSAYGDCAC